MADWQILTPMRQIQFEPQGYGWQDLYRGLLAIDIHKV